MANETTHYFRGPVMFAKVFEGNRDKGMYAPEGGQYTIDIGLKGSDVKLVKSWNKRYAPKKYKPPYDEGVDDKLEYFQFKRRHEQFNKNGELITEWSGPPKVFDDERNDWGNRGLIGNGSVCTIKLNVYNGTFTDNAGKQLPYTSVRLDGVRVDEWVEYEGNKSDDTEDDNDIDDEIPF